jgi:hypothetical protein
MIVGITRAATIPPLTPTISKFYFTGLPVFPLRSSRPLSGVVIS